MLLKVPKSLKICLEVSTIVKSSIVPFYYNKTLLIINNDLFSIQRSNIIQNMKMKSSLSIKKGNELSS